jgi:hypothetical protein
MRSYVSSFLMGFFLLFLSLVRLFDKDYYGFSIFLFFSSLFFLSFFIESRRETKTKDSEERKRVFSSLSVPRVSSRKEGNSEITTLVVPSLELFNEMKNEDMQVKRKPS